MCFLEIRALEAGPFGNSESSSVCMCGHECVHVIEGFLGPVLFLKGPWVIASPPSQPFLPQGFPHAVREL